MDCQVNKKSHFPHLLLFAFNGGQKASEVTKDICAAYGKDAIAERAVRDWFSRFKRGFLTSTTLLVPEDQSRWTKTNSGIF